MADGTDWDAYRQQAGQQSANLNSMPFVFNPANMTGSVTQNTQSLYGQGDNSGGIAKTIDQAFTDYYGRPAKAEDMQAWLAQAQTSGLSAGEIKALIEKAALLQGNASTPGASGAVNPATKTSFGGGLMGGNALAGGGMSFSGGLMGG